MALTIDRNTDVISILQADLTFISGTQYELDADQFRKDLAALAASEEGIVFDDAHEHTGEKVLAGITYARFVEILTPFTVTFEDLQYAVDIVAANTNIKDKTNRNQAGVGSNNSAGLINLTALNDILKIFGLEIGSPMSVSPTQRTAGSIVQTITVAGQTVTVTRTS